MSAFTVTNTHINALVRYASRKKLSVPYGHPSVRLNVSEHEQQVAQLLLDENIKSVNYRYSEKESGFIAAEIAPPMTACNQIVGFDG
jgi:hypothetical protein